MVEMLHCFTPAFIRFMRRSLPVVARLRHLRFIQQSPLREKMPDRADEGVSIRMTLNPTILPHPACMRGLASEVIIQ
jgi:hypothetical protein